MKRLLILCLVCFLVSMDQVIGERILILAIVPLYSHQTVIRGLGLALNKRGHEIVIVTSHPMRDSSLTNYTEIDYSGVKEVMRNVYPYLMNYEAYTELEMNEIAYDLVYAFTEYFYTFPEILKLFAADCNEKFDLVIVEGLVGPGIYPVAYKLNAPLIGVISLDMHIKHHYILGNSLLPSHLSNWELYRRTGSRMSFWNRVQNFVHVWRIVYQWYNHEIVRLEMLTNRLFENDLPPLLDMAKNMSLLLVNHDPLIGHVRPQPPNVVFFSGFHITDDPPPLSTELREFLDNASNGFIYMSLGSHINSSMLPPKALKVIFNVFAGLPCKVLWKFETDSLPRKHRNIFISGWISQQKVLAHPNIKLFIYQGGVQSTEETIHFGVPIIGMPVMFDQTFEIKRLVSLGAGRMLDFTTIDEETFQEAVIDVLNNKSYKTKMMELNRLAKDKPYDSKEHALWWVEYVMRHKGAPHLRFKGSDDPWYQRFDMDVIAFLSIVSFVVTITCVIIFIRIFRWWYKHYMLLSFAKHFSFEQTRSKVE